MAYCQFVKRNGEQCRHFVAPGQQSCWQHAKGWRAKLRSLTRSQAVGFSVAVLSLLTTVGFGIWAILPKTPLPSPPTTNISVQSSGDNSPNVVDNQGSVTIQPAPSKKKSSDEPLKKQKP
jgi:hypothetical protein